MGDVQYKPDLDHGITLDVVFEALELKMKHRRKGLEHETLLGVLKTITFGVVFVLAFHHFDSNKVLERFVEILHPLDVQLYICETGEREQIHELRTSRG